MLTSPAARRAPAWALLMFAVAGVASGCGGSTSDQDKVKGVVTGFLKDVSEGKGEAGCAQLTDAAVQQLDSAAFLLHAPASCADAITLFSRQLSSDEKKAYKNAKVVRATVTGDTATVADSDIEIKVSGQTSPFRNADPRPVELVRSGSTWRISSLG